MHPIYDTATFVFDPLHRLWEHRRMRRMFGMSFLAAFFLGLIFIQCNRSGLLPPQLAAIAPTNHFYAVQLAFTLVLVEEVIDLVFALPCSVSDSVGKQLEILALILLRNSFKELVHFPEPIHFTSLEPVLRITSYGLGALCLFVILGFYFKALQHQPTLKRGVDRYRFVSLKKGLSLVLLAIFLVSAVYDGWLTMTGGKPYSFFETFFTALIFTDILIVLMYQQFVPAFHAVFRNSGYALATLFMRIALAAPVYYDTAIGVGAGLFALLLTLAYNHACPLLEQGNVCKHDPS